MPTTVISTQAPPKSFPIGSTAVRDKYVQDGPLSFCYSDASCSLKDTESGGTFPLVRDQLADGEAGGRGRRRRVPDVHELSSLDVEDEVVHETAVAGHRLGPHPRGPGHDVGVCQFWNESLTCRDEGTLGKVAIHLGRPGAPVLARHPPEPRVAQGLGEVAGPQRRTAVPLTRQGEYRVGPEPYRPVADPPGEVH